MPEHSPEPWAPIGEGFAVIAADGRRIFSRDPHPESQQTPQRRHANWRRILACVNALAGVPTAALEGTEQGACPAPVARLVAAARELLTYSVGTPGYYEAAGRLRAALAPFPEE